MKFKEGGKVKYELGSKITLEIVAVKEEKEGCCDGCM